MRLIHVFGVVLGLVLMACSEPATIVPSAGTAGKKINSASQLKALSTTTTLYYLNEMVTLNLGTYDGCTGDFPVGTAKVHTVMKVTLNTDGTFHSSLHGNLADGKLVGVYSGVSYVLQAGAKFDSEENFSAGTFDQLNKLKLILISKGNQANYRIDITVRAHYDPVNGYSFSFDEKAACHG
jgi:hypothetical protein